MHCLAFLQRSICSAILMALVALTAVQAIWTGDFLSTTTTGYTVQSDGMGSITIALTQPPVCTGFLYLQSDQADLDQCMLTFTRDNYNVPQTVQVVSKQFLDTYNIYVAAKYVGCAGDALYGRESLIHLVGAQTKSATCAVTGDPHYTTFDGNNANVLTIMGSGDFYLVKSDLITVQARQSGCLNQATCIFGLAIRFGDAIWLVDPNRAGESSLNHIGQNGVQWVQRNEGIQSTILTANGFDSLNFQLSGGSTITLDIHNINGTTNYINFQLSISGHMQHRVLGLCGTFDGNLANDYTGSDGHVYSGDTLRAQVAADFYSLAPNFAETPLGLYGNSWRVPESDNLFKCGVNCDSVQPSVFNTQLNHCVWPNIPATPPVMTTTTTTTTTTAATATTAPYDGTDDDTDYGTDNGTDYGNHHAQPPFHPVIVDQTPNGYMIHQGTDHDGAPIIPPPTVIPPAISAHALQAAVDACSTMITGTPACVPYTHLPSLISMCQLDMRASQAADPAAIYKSYNLVYATSCARGLRLQRNNPSRVSAMAANTKMRAMGFGDHDCDSSCAVCSDRGCLQCKDAQNYHVNGGTCVRIPHISHDY
ncbi:Mucin-5B [Sorochytrium milnesiophthora]